MSSSGRVARDEWRRRRRRRRFTRGLGKALFWMLVLAGVFVLGVGFGKTVSSGGGEGAQVTITRDRGAVTATLPTRTVTKTVVKTRPARRRSR